MKIHLDSAPEEARIEILPLIDVIFCILTFFLLAALGLTRQSAINVDLPRAETGTQQMRDMLMISVDAIGQLYVEQTAVPRDRLQQEIVSYVAGNPEGLIVVYASRSAEYNDVLQVLDLARSIQGARVALATAPQSELEEQEFNSPFDWDSLPGTLELEPNQVPTLPDENLDFDRPRSSDFPPSNSGAPPLDLTEPTEPQTLPPSNRSSGTDAE